MREWLTATVNMEDQFWYLRVQLGDGNVGDPEVDVPVVLPLLVLHALPRGPSQSNLQEYSQSDNQ